MGKNNPRKYETNSYFALFKNVVSIRFNPKHAGWQKQKIVTCLFAFCQIKQTFKEHDEKWYFETVIMLIRCFHHQVVLITLSQTRIFTVQCKYKLNVDQYQTILGFTTSPFKLFIFDHLSCRSVTGGNGNVLPLLVRPAVHALSMKTLFLVSGNI